MTALVLTESLLRSLLARHFGFLAASGFGEPLVEWEAKRNSWRVTYGSDAGMAVQAVVDAEAEDIITQIVAPKSAHAWSLDTLADVPPFQGCAWTRESADRRFATEAATLRSVEDLLSGDVWTYRERAL